MRFKTLLSLSAVLSLSASFGAMATSSPNFDYLQAGYTQIDDNEKLDGFHVEGSYSLTDTVFVRGEHQDVSETLYGVHAGAKMTSLALGLKAPATDTTSYYAALSFEDVGSEVGPFRESADGFGAYVGAKSFVSPQVELYGEFSYLDIHDFNISEFGYELGGQYYFDDALSAGLSYRRLDDTSLVNAGVRYSF